MKILTSLIVGGSLMIGSALAQDSKSPAKPAPAPATSSAPAAPAKGAATTSAAPAKSGKKHHKHNKVKAGASSTAASGTAAPSTAKPAVPAAVPAK